MKIYELVSEETIGSVGTTTAPPSPVSPTSTSATPPTDQATTKPDPSKQQLDQLLKQNQINVHTSDDFLKAFSAIQQKQQLTPDQEKVLGDYAKATIAKPGLPTQMAGLMKTIMANKPASTPGTTPPSATPPGVTPPTAA